MQRYTNVKSSANEVKPLEINEYFVTINNGIKEVHEEADTEMGGGFDGWEIEEQIIYDKDEYIGLITMQNAELEATVNSILTDVIPSMLG